MSLIPVILCGGAGSRLWPVSRESHPKPFIRLADGQSLLQKAFLRGAQLAGVSQVLTVTNREFFFKTEDEFREVNAGRLPTSVLLEPFGRNPAAAVAAASLLVAEKEPEATLLVLAADHLIADQAAFEAAVESATALASEGNLVTFGIQPDAPETGYGYITRPCTSVPAAEEPTQQEPSKKDKPLTNFEKVKLYLTMLDPEHARKILEIKKKTKYAWSYFGISGEQATQILELAKK